jgi:hypothetical protein
MGQFKPGHPGGPGRPKLPQDIKELRQLNRMELERVLNECLNLTPAQLKKIKDDPESTMLQLMVVSIITHGTNKGDQSRLGFLLDQLLGKVPDQLKSQVNFKVSIEDYTVARNQDQITTQAKALLTDS